VICCDGKSWFYSMLLTICIACCARPCVAEGALAIGLPSDVARHGVAIGWAVNYPNASEAQKKALQLCSGYEAAGPPARQACKIVDTFVKECLAIAMDSEAGTDGIGWSVKSSIDKARSEATAKCRATADPGRERLCKVESSCCDGKKC
jgi:uncharacterized protein DUF4189